MRIDWKKFVMLERRFWIKLGSEICDMIRDETVVKGQDVRGKKFKPLSDKPVEPYWFSKGKGTSRKSIFVESYKSRKGKGVFPRQSEPTDRANLHLTGDMMQDLQVRAATRKWVKFGWTATESAKVQGNAKHGREIVGTRKNPLSRTVLAMAVGRIKRQIDLNIKNNRFHLKVKMG